jgi:hypothetical protein
MVRFQKYVNLFAGASSLFGVVKGVIKQKAIIGEYQRIWRLNKNAMSFLLFWAIINILLSLSCFIMPEGFLRYYLEMNLFWNVVTLFFAGPGFITARRKVDEVPSLVTPVDFLTQFTATQKVLLFNAGLDIAYIVAAVFLIDRGTIFSDVRIQAYGANVLFQGIFLLGFDAVLYLINNTLVNNAVKNFES